MMTGCRPFDSRQLYLCLLLTGEYNDRRVVIPLKLRKGFVTYVSDGEQLMVAAGPAAKLFHGMVKSNETAAFIIDHMKKDTTVDKITDELCAEYDVPADVAKKDVEKVIEQLRAIGAVDE